MRQQILMDFMDEFKEFCKKRDDIKSWKAQIMDEYPDGIYRLSDDKTMVIETVRRIRIRKAKKSDPEIGEE